MKTIKIILLIFNIFVLFLVLLIIFPFLFIPIIQANSWLRTEKVIEFRFPERTIAVPHGVDIRDIDLHFIN